MSKHSFAENCVLVTGGAGALGQAVVEYFETAGARVAVLDYSSEILDSVFDNKKPQNLYLACDLTDRDSCHKGVDLIAEEFGRIDILCNIAGGFLMGSDVHETTDETWDFLFNLNTRSILNMAAFVVPLMLAENFGKIVNISARAAISGAAKMGVYTASKAAVMRLTQSMALELREKGINVNCIMPGTIDTKRNREDMPDADHDKWVPTNEIAKVIGFLASGDAIAVHGACIPVDGLS